MGAQQRMQPLYFHYQVDCNRDETSGDDDNDDSKQNINNKSVRSNHSNDHTPSIGPRLKRKDYRNNGNNKRMQQQHIGNDNGYNNNNKRSGLRMVQQRKNGNNGDNKKIVGKLNQNGVGNKNGAKTTNSQNARN